MQTKSISKFWSNWLVAVTTGVTLYGLSMVLVPTFTQQFFGLLLFGDPGAMAGFGQPAAGYIAFAHGVLGSVMAGWGAALLVVLYSQFMKGDRAGWIALAVSITVWFIPDTLFSLWTGFWQNALFNLVFLLLFAIPLAATWREFGGGTGRLSTQRGKAG